MKTIITGSRTIDNVNLVKSLISTVVREEGLHITQVVSGGAYGPDTIGKWWAEDHSIPIEEFPADWKQHGKRAGYIRNKEMAEYSEALIAIWDGKSKGTQHMIDLAEDYGLDVYIKIV